MKVFSALSVAAVCVGVVLATGCRSNSRSGSPEGVDLTGAGGTFPNPIYQRWFTEYSNAHPGVHINYQSIGSGAGIRQVSEQTIDFGASDGPMTDQQLAEAKGKILHVPTVLGAVVPTYNLPGLSQDLNFSPEVIAGIYLGAITKWNDSNIVRENPGVTLPDRQILPVYRSDGSGTTYIFTDFLSKTVAAFQNKIGKGTSVRFPVGIGGKGNEGVAGVVRNSPYSFGYVELIYALQTHMSYGLVRNAAGKFVKGSIDGVTAAAAGAAANMPADFRVSITNAPGIDSYPISSFTWLLIPEHWNDKAKEKVMVDFLHWMLGPGEAEAPSMGYAPLPATMAAKVAQEISLIR